jgi:hypothetical protein
MPATYAGSSYQNPKTQHVFREIEIDLCNLSIDQKFNGYVALVSKYSIVVFFIFSQNAIIRADDDRKD